ncbi:phosphotransferase [Nonomuraea sp. SMC257]|uniref:Phosphotransferase n=1 Tax=Nonomuraea montanisoli TaxID=2741721 RepID=A0A7Y6I3L6_9ACTN|nr:phosphotransferase [Nonomuraea montanisoli]NUW30846.1 phosphotransferase [Nonomuraea montanisoli]
MSRIPWEHLPVAVRDKVQNEVGQVVKAETAEGGIMPGIASRLYLDDGSSVFLKAIAKDDPAARLHERQEWAGRVLPKATPTPRMLWSAHADGWIVFVHEYVNDGAKPADLSPGSPDVPIVLALLRRLTSVLTPCPAPDAPLIGDNLAPLRAKGQAMLGKHAYRLSAADQVLYETALAGFDPAALEGDGLIHYDLHSDNILILLDHAVVLDWSFAARAASWVDAALLAPRLVEAGHQPKHVQWLLSEVPAWTAAPPAAVRGLAAMWTLFRVYKATFGPPEARRFRARAAEAGRAWTRYCLDAR